jgi:glycosyltransferase involved in cell wall biosynthesis
MTRRPRLLFLAYLFPPSRAIGAVRAWNIAKHLARRGWEVTAVTPDPRLWRHAEPLAAAEQACAREKITRRLTGHGWRFLNRDVLRCRCEPLAHYLGGIARRVARRFDLSLSLGWKRAVRRACRPLAPGSVDLILATGTPYIAFEIADELSQRLHCPFVMDYRDPWTAIDPHPQRCGGPLLRNRIKEERLLRRCAAATVIAPSSAELMREMFDLGEKIHFLPNGYDPEELEPVSPYDFGHFAIVYTGHFHLPLRSAAPLTAALGRLQNQLPHPPRDWRFHYYGPQIDYVRETARTQGILERMVFHGTVPRPEALSAIKGAGLAVVIATTEPRATVENRGIITGKIFEPIGLGTPLLLVAPPGSDVERVIAETGLAERFSGDEVEAMANFIAAALSGKTPPPRAPAAYSWPELAGRLDPLLRNALAGSSS